MKKLLLSCFALMTMVVNISIAQIITTFAGNGTAGFAGDGSLATSATLNTPENIAFDAAGNLYFADAGNNRIRKIDKISHIISTVVGDGTDGFGGDGGLAINANLKQPAAIAFDAVGNMFIADQYNKRIRKVDVSTGIITTVAGDGSATNYGGDGGAATGAHLSYPVDIALDAAGNLYISDLNNFRIRKVDASTGIITTVVGNGGFGYNGDGILATNAQLRFPVGIKVDAGGNIYFSDQGNYRIRKVDGTTGIISTIAGTGTAGFSGDGGLATSATLNQPYSLTMDAAGNIYLSDFSNFSVRKINKSTGIITTLTGTGTAGYSGDGGLASAAQIQSAWGVAVDGNGNIFISDTQNERIRKISGTMATNIDCASATTLTASPVGDASCTSSVNGDLNDVAGIPGLEATCDNGWQMHSLWYKFTATQTIHKVVLKNLIPNNGAAVQFYRGTDCSNIAPETCYGVLGNVFWNSDSSAYTAINLIPGQEYFFKIKGYEYSTLGSFSVCVTSPPYVAPPVNDDICNATAITPSADGSCNPVQGTTVGATPQPIPSNSSTDYANDVWYSFVAAQPYQSIVVKGFGSEGFNTILVLYSGNCSFLTYIYENTFSYSSSDSLVAKYFNLTVGNTYYLRIGHAAISYESFNFTVCLTSPPLPANDVCTSAAVLTPAVNFIGTPGSTKDVSGTWQTCDNDYHDDVWYKFTATTTSHKIVVKGYDFVTNYGSGIEFFGGADCNNLTSFGCASYQYGGSDSIYYDATNLVPGTSYNFTVFSAYYADQSHRDFEVGVTGAPLGCTYTVPDLFDNANSITANYGAICDFNGESDYSDNLSGYTVIHPVIPGGLVKLDFTLFNTDPNDIVYIYDGDGINGTLLYSGSGNPATLPSVVSVTGTLTIQFISDADGVTGPGFSALISNLPNPCPGATLYVDAAMPSSGNGTSWGAAFKTLSEALYVANRCTDVTEVRVSQGTYYPSTFDGQVTTSRDSSFVIQRDGYRIFGGYNHSDERDDITYITRLSGDIGNVNDNTDNSYHVVKVIPLNAPINPETLLDGVIIQDGNADGSSLQSASSNDGAGMYVDARFYQCAFSISNLKFLNNRASNNGGGLFLDAANTSASCIPAVNNVIFQTNYAAISGGGMYMNIVGENSFSNTVINNCTFAGNEAGVRGGGLYNYGASPGASSTALISTCGFINNTASSGGAIGTNAESGGYANSHVTTSVFIDNHATVGGGAMYMYGGNGENHSGATKSTFSNNSADLWGGAIAAVGGDFTNGGNAHTAYEFDDCVFTGNSSGAKGGAIAMDDGINENELKVVNCTFNNNHTNGSSTNIIQYNAFNAGMNPAAILNCIFGNDLIEPDQAKFNVQYSLINDANFAGNQNIISGTPGFINAADADGPDNQFNTADDGLRLSTSSAAIDAGNTIYAPSTDIVGNARPFGVSADMGAYESFESKTIVSCPGFASLYVDGSILSSGNGSSWATAFKTVSEALYVANQCTIADSIFVAEGTYHPANDDGSVSLNRFTSFRIFRNNIKLYGGYPAGGGIRNVELHPTILSGDINNDDNGLTNNEENTYHILIIYPDSLAINAINNNTIVDGLTFKGGNAGSSTFLYTDIHGREIIYWLGGAIYNKADYPSSFGESSPVINNCTFIDNNAYRGGGAIYSTAAHGKTTPLISNCTFRNNNSSNDAVGGGAIAIDGYSYPNPPLSKLFLEKCVFENNHAAGTGGALAATFGVGIIANNTVFSSNTALDGAAINLLSNSSQNAIFNNCLFVNNTAGSTGSVFNGGLAAFNNCTFSGNNTNVGNNEMFGSLSPDAEPFKRISIRNCIFDIGSTIYDNGFGSLTTKYTVKNTFIQEPIFAGSGNITNGSNPYFKNTYDPPAGADGIFGTADDGFQLGLLSYLADLGDTTGLGNIIPATDLRGANRIYNNVIDMGCYEKNYSCYDITLSETHTNTSCTGAPVGTITVTASGTTGTVSYLLSPGGENNTTGVFTGLAAGRYNVHIQDENDCPRSIDITIGTTDIIPPVISTCPSPRSAASSPPYCLAVVPDFTGDVVASDNCSSNNQLIITQSVAAGTLTSAGVTNIIITVTDAAGNYSNCNTSFTVTGTPPGKPSNIISDPVYSNVCSIIGTATSVRYSVTAVAGYSYDWVIPQNTIIDSGSTGNKIRLRFLTGYVFDVNDSLKVRAVSFCGPGVLYSRLAIKSGVPHVPSSTTGFSLCGPGTATLKATAISGNTIDWYDGSGALLQTGTVAGSNSFNTFVTVTTTFYAAVRNLKTDCSSARIAVTATVNALPFAPAIASITPVCSRGTATITVVPSPGISFNWFSTATGGTAIRTGNPFTTGNISSNTTFYVEAKNTVTGCVSATRTAATVIVYTKPDAPVISMPVVCGSNPVTLFATPGIDEVIDWYSELNNTLVATASNSFTTPYNVSSGIIYDRYYAVARNLSTGCVSVGSYIRPETYNIPPPPLNTTTISERCGPGVVNLSANAGSQVVLWYDAGGSQLAGGNNYHPNINSTTTFYAGTKSGNGCYSSTKIPIIATVNPIPDPPFSSGGVATCAGITVMATVITPGPNQLVDWFQTASGGNTIRSNDNHYYFIVPVPKIVRVYAQTRTMKGCVSATRTEVVATINAVPVAPVITMPVVCGSNPVTLFATPGINEVIDWYSELNNTLVATASNSFTTPYNVSSGIIYDRYYAVARNLSTGCVSVGSYIRPETYNIPPPPLNTTTISERCGPGVINLSANAGSQVVLWYDAGGSQLAGGNNYHPNINSTTTFYAGTKSGNGCYSSTKIPIVATVNPIPAAPISAGNVAVCGIGPVTVTVTATAGPGESIDWYSAAAGGTLLFTGASYTTTINSSVNFYAVARGFTGCISATRTAVKASISKRIPGTTGAITGPTDICPFLGTGTATYSIPSVTYATSYDWTVPAGATIVGGEGTTSITVSFSSINPSGDIISVKARSGCGISATGSSLAINRDACPPLAKGIVNTAVQKSVPVIKAIIAPVANESMDVTIYPNPTNADFNLKVITASKEKIQVKISDLQGRLLKRFTVMPYKTVQIGNELLTGVYMIEVRQGKQVKVTRVIKF